MSISTSLFVILFSVFTSFHVVLIYLFIRAMCLCDYVCFASASRYGLDIQLTNRCVHMGSLIAMIELLPLIRSLKLHNYLANVFVLVHKNMTNSVDRSIDFVCV